MNQLTLIKQIAFCVLFFCLLTTNLSAQISKTVECTAGNLSSLLTAEEKRTINSVVIKGTMDARDFFFIRNNMFQLASLDLSMVEVKSYSTSGQNYPSDAIPDQAFDSFRGTSFSKIKLPNNLRSIGKKAFQFCSQLDTIFLPETVTIIDDYAFYSCDNLKSINFPLALTSIGIAAFHNCSFTSIDIKSTLSTIKNSAFLYCTKLEKVGIANVDSIGNRAFDLCFSMTTFNANSIKTMGDYVFDNCNSLDNVTLPNSLVSLGKGTFDNCTNLKSISLPTSITYLPAETFKNCYQLASVVIPSAITGIGRAAFSNCTKLTELNIPPSIETIGNSAFVYCSIKQINFPLTLVAIGDSAFFGSALVDVAFQSANCTIGKYVFTNCTTLSSCLLPTSIANVPANTFRGCSSLSSISLPETLTSIDDGAFKGCTNLQLNSMPSGLISIGNNSFSGCSNITIQNLPNTLKSIGARAFNSCPKITISTLPSTLTRIEASTFNSCVGIQSFIVPNSVTYIGDSVFFHLINLSLIDLPQSVTYIGQYAFTSCKKLINIVLPPITELKEGTFYSCDLLKSVQLPENLFSIGKEAFYNCYQLPSIILPSSLTSIGQRAFEYCGNLSEMKVLSLTPPQTNYLSLGSGSIVSLRKVIVPYGTSYFYKAATGWKDFKNIIEIPRITLSAYFIDISAKEGKDSSIQVLSNANWTASSDQLWLQINTPEGNGKLSFSFHANSSLTKRTANITIASLGLTPQILQVTQAPSEAKIDLSLTTDTVVIDATNGSFKEIIVNSNTSWSAISNETWLKIDPVSTTNGNGTLTITATENQTARYRIATVTITGEKTQPRMITVVQNDSSHSNKLTSFPESVKLPAGSGGSVFIQVFSTLKWSASTAYSWIKISGDSINGNGQLEISANENREIYQRSGDVYINATGMPPLRIQVVQEAAKSFFTLSNTSIELNFDNGSKDSIYLDTNVNWSAYSDQSWLTIAPTSYQSGNKLIITATENTGNSSRQAIITISAYTISPSQKIIVNQKSKVTQKTLTITAGTLSQSLTSSEKQSITDITILGTMDARDFRTLRDSIPNLERINLKEATIQAYSEIYDTEGYLYQTNYAENTVPGHSFNKYYDWKGSQIRSIILPSNTIGIESSAFKNCKKLNVIEMPASISTIGDNAFYECNNLIDFPFPASLVSIGEEAFFGCNQLTDITIPSSVNSMGNSVFYGCSNLQRVRILGQLTTISQNAFCSCSKLSSILIPQSVYFIADGAFSGCVNLTNIDIPNSVKTIGISAFSGCYKLNSIKLPGSVTTIDGGSFSNCRSLTSIEIPSSIRLISHYLFNGCTLLESVTLPNSIIEIGIEAFNGCGKLASITIPSSVKKIGRASFRDCSNLKEVIALPAIPVDISGLGGVFENVNKNTCILYVPVGSKQLYQNAYEWKDFTNIQELNTLTLSTSSVTLGAAEGSSDLLYITSNLSWKAVSDQIWLTVNPISANGGKNVLVLKASVNPNVTIRTATVAISVDGIEPQLITVNQAAGDSIFTVSESSLKNSNMLERRKVKITTNYKWTATSNQTWLTVSPNTGISSDSITITSLKNEGALRTGIVTVSSMGFIPKQITVTQAAVDTLKIDSPTYLTLNEFAGNKNINVISNVDWNVESNQKWLTVSSLSGSKNGVITISTSKNTGYSRTGIITISAKGLRSIEIYISQSSAKNVLLLSLNNLSLPCEAYRYSYLEVKSNAGWSVNSDQSWLKVSPNSGYGNSSLDLIAEANTNFNSRKATITIAVNDSVKQLINVTQEATVRKLMVSQNKISIEQSKDSESSISINSNLSWIVNCDQNWLSIDTIAGEGNKTLTFTALENTDFASRTAVVTISADGVFDQIISVIQSAQPGMPDLIVKRTNTAPKVDGIIDANDPWSTQWIPMSTPCWRNTTSAMNAKFQILAGDDAFYIGIVIKDTTRYTYNNVSLSSYEKDCSEIFISMDTVPSNTNVLGKAGNWMLRTHREDGSFVESNRIDALKADPKFSAISRTSDREYIQELVIPYSTLFNGMSTDWDKMYFRFDIAASDNTTGNFQGRTQQQFWNSGSDEQWKDTQYYGKAKIETNGTGLDLNKSIINMTSIDSLATFAIESSVSWTIESDQNWLTFSQSSGTNSKTINVFATRNSGVARSAILTISAIGLPSKTITITQSAGSATLSVSEVNLNLGSASNSKAAFNITSNTTWSITNDQSWLSVSPSSGTGNGTVTLTATGNTTNAKRMATVTVNGQGASSKVINITQLAEEAAFDVSPLSVQIAKEQGSTATSTISSNVSWKASSNANWLSVTPFSGTGNGQLLFIAQANSTTTSRSATVVVESNGLSSKTITITQSAGSATLLVSEENLKLSSANNSKTAFNITSNTSWSITNDQSWLTVSPSTGTGNSEITLNAQENTLSTTRKATITIIANGAESKTVQIVQNATEAYLSVTPHSIEIPAEAADPFSFSINSNSSWFVSGDADWLIISTKSGNGNGELNFNAKPNLTTEKRNTLVTVTSNGLPQQNISITQDAAKEYLIISEESQMVPKEGGELILEVKSNSNWEVNSDQKWLFISQAKGTGDRNIKVIASANILFEERKANIIVSCPGFITKQVSIIQEANLIPIQIPDSNISFSALGGDTTINITTNETWLASSDQSWLSLSPDFPFSGNGVLTFTFEPNLDEKERKAKVSIFTNDFSSTIDVVQEASQRIDGVDIPEQNQIKLFPTLIDESFTIVGLEGKAELIISDNNGRVLMKKQIVNNEGISLEKLRKGVYFVSITTSKASMQYKIVKQ